jgi:lantibiotic modifying enzyme
MREHDDGHLDVARRIALYLCETAYSYGGESTWLGMTQHAEEDSGVLDFTFQTLGPDLYGGTSGVALFLAEAYAHSSDVRVRNTAEEAISHALARARMLPRPSRFGLYDGLLGIGYAAARVGKLLDVERIERAAREIVAGLVNDVGDDVLADVVSGAAGGIPALLILGESLGSDAPLRCAESLGDRLLATATRSNDGWSWGEEATGIESERDLTGFSHGAAGIGWALSELYAATGESRFRQGAWEAFHYERSCFRPAESNWPDFRESDGSEEPAPCGVAWCHGAPGIGLSRLRALGAPGGEALRSDVAAAIRTTKWALSDPFRPIDADFSLCHGRGGLIECLLLAAEALGDDQAREEAMAAAVQGAERYGKTPAAWPCGVRRGSNPSLMLGLAGVGYLYLRLADSALPSVLLVRPATASVTLENVP